LLATSNKPHKTFVALYVNVAQSVPKELDEACDTWPESAIQLARDLLDQLAKEAAK